ncbi:MAG: glycosyltransferase family 4 protein [Nitrososphaerales archaeon]
MERDKGSERDPVAKGTPARVLLVTFDPPGNIGGIEGRVEGYVKELSKRGGRAEVLALAPEYKSGISTFWGTRMYELSSRPAQALCSLLATERVLVNRKLDSVFLVSGAITLYGNALLAESRLMRRRTAVLFYGRDILQARRGLLRRMMMLASIVLSNTVFTNSRFTASLLPPFAGRKQRVLYPSVDPTLGPAGPSGQRTGHRVLFVGRLVRRKGADDLIKAFRSISESLPDWRLEIVGDGPERKRLEQLVADLGLGERVEFFGSLRGRALYDRYGLCDVVAMPSKRLRDDVEGFGTVFLEAGIFGKPSVGAFSGGIPESIVDGETGILVREGDARQLETALERLLSDPELRLRMGRKARERVLRDFTWQQSAARLEEGLSTQQTPGASSH